MKRQAWLFSAPVDVGAFLGAALLSMAALGIGARVGVLHEETPGWTWIPAVLMVDVAHVWSTLFRTYLDPRERRRRRALYTVVPIAAFVALCALWSRGPATFWRALAYVAIFHFVRQQHGWIALYRARGGEKGRAGLAIDVAAIYAATGYPLLYWHTHVPRRFAWFVAGDVVALPAFLDRIGLLLWALALGAYATRSGWRWLARGVGSVGKDLVVVTTAVCWWVGLVTFDSDYAFTVTNVFIHGVPYFVLVYAFARRASPRIHPIVAAGPLAFIGATWALAYVEELLWDRALWHERPWLFGGPWTLGALSALIVPLLAVPQLTHYVLDGFVWRRRDDPQVGRVLGLPARAAAQRTAPAE
ncbi:MAG: hypothetical protein NVS3B10_18550 [Polyangiales bacterium]